MEMGERIREKQERKGNIKIYIYSFFMSSLYASIYKFFNVKFKVTF